MSANICNSIFLYSIFHILYYTYIILSIQYKENQATQKQRSQDKTFLTTKERLRNPNVDSYPNISYSSKCTQYI